MAVQFVDDGRRTYSKWYSSLQGWYEIYRGYWRGKSDPMWNNVHIPALFSIIMAHVARLHAVLFGEEPYVGFIPSGPEDVKKARKNEKLIAAQLEMARIREKSLRYLLQSAMYGVGVCQVGWRKQYGPTWRRTGAVNGRALKVRGRKSGSSILKFDCPDFEVLDGSDTVPSIGYMDVQDMPGYARRYYIPYNDIVMGAHEGPGGEPPIYDPEEVQRMGGSSPGRGVTDDMSERQSMAAGGVDEKTWAQLSSQTKPVECYDVYMTVPPELGLFWDPDSGQWDTEDFPGSEFTTELLITVADRAFLLRAIPNPTWLQEKPFLVHRPFEDPHYYHAPGMIEIGLKPQVAINRLVNSQLDAYDLWMNPPWIADGTRVDPRTLRNGPGRVNLVEGPVGPDVIQQLQPNLQGVRDAFQETSYLWQILQQGEGIGQDVGMGIATSKRQTRAEFLGREGAMGVRVGLATALAEVQFLEPLARWFFELNRQFLDLRTTIDLIGGHAIWDEVAGAFLAPDDPMVLTDDDLMPDFDIRSAASSRALGKAARQQNMLAFLPAWSQFLTQVPLIMQTLPTFNLWAFGRQVHTLFDLKNTDEIFGTEDQVRAATTLAAMQGVLGGGQNGQGAGGLDGGGMFEGSGPPESPSVGAFGPTAGVQAGGLAGTAN